MWGDVATWVGSVGTTGALIVAILLAVRDRGRRRIDAERRQASQVSAWLELAPPPENKVLLVARNASLSQINDVRGVIEDFADQPPSRIETWIPGLPPTGVPIYIELPVEPPNERQKYRYELTYEFTDLDMRRWRHARGDGLVLLEHRAARVDYDSTGNPIGVVRDVRRPHGTTS